MRTRILFLCFLFISACTLIPKTDVELVREMDLGLSNNDLRAAYDSYSRLSDKGKSEQAVIKKYQQLKQKITIVSDKTAQQASQAINRGDWKQASDLYHAQIALTVIDPAFHTHYQKFQQQLKLKKEPLKNDLLIVKADYLIQKRKMERLIQQLDPHDIENEKQLKATREEAKIIYKLLLAQGLDALHNNDIATARKLIPLAKGLINSKTARKATQTLEQLTRPMEEYIEKLTEYGTKLYGGENYRAALEIWEDILYIDPNNEKIQANKERTEKVLQSLEKIKQGAVDQGLNG